MRSIAIAVPVALFFAVSAGTQQVPQKLGTVKGPGANGRLLPGFYRRTAHNAVQPEPTWMG
jgi:hypothetical protein